MIQARLRSAADVAIPIAEARGRMRIELVFGDCVQAGRLMRIARLTQIAGVLKRVTAIEVVPARMQLVP
jgi:hypothetical protein